MLREIRILRQRIVRCGKVRSSLIAPAERQQALADLLVNVPVGRVDLLVLLQQRLVDRQSLGTAAERPHRASNRPSGDPRFQGLVVIGFQLRLRPPERVQRLRKSPRVMVVPADVVQQRRSPSLRRRVRRRFRQSQRSLVSRQRRAARLSHDRQHVRRIDRQIVLS